MRKTSTGELRVRENRRHGSEGESRDYPIDNMFVPIPMSYSQPYNGSNKAVRSSAVNFNDSSLAPPL
jgi:hypothetical protein